MSRTKLVIGNWKMNLSVPESTILLEKIKKEIAPKHTEVVVCPGFLDIYSAAEVLQGTEIGIGAQNVSADDGGAFTGEVSAHQLKGFVEYSIVGHSERRHLFGETDRVVCVKAASCVKHDIIPIVCVGESLHDRTDGLTNMVVSSQLESSLSDLTPAEIAKIVVAYEPVWAIGTGHVCDAKKAQTESKKIRNLLKVLYGSDVAEKVRIVYGGSITDKNAKPFLGCADIDGFLVGGSSIEHEIFSTIVAVVDGTEKMPKSKSQMSNKTQSSKSKKKK